MTFRHRSSGAARMRHRTEQYARSDHGQRDLRSAPTDLRCRRWLTWGRGSARNAGRSMWRAVRLCADCDVQLTDSPAVLRSSSDAASYSLEGFSRYETDELDRRLRASHIAHVIDKGSLRVGQGDGAAAEAVLDDLDAAARDASSDGEEERAGRPAAPAPLQLRDDQGPPPDSASAA